MIIRFLVVAGALVCAQTAITQEAGKEVFQQTCAACHSIGGGRLVGPDLAGVSDRRPERWLIEFVKSSQTVIQSGDQAAGALFREFNQIVMPDQALSDDQIKGILAYIKQAEGNPGDHEGVASQGLASTRSKIEDFAESGKPAPIINPTPDEIMRGQNLLQGKLRFKGGGPSCISCHNTNNPMVISGGSLAADLTTAFSRLGSPGIRAILTTPPFPVMQAAYAGRPLEDDEIRALVGFLQNADRENILHQPREYGWAMFGAGLGGVGVLLGLYSLLWRRRKQHSVNQEMYDRQGKSE